MIFLKFYLSYLIAQIKIKFNLELDNLFLLMDAVNNEPKATFSIKLIFVLFGIASLLGWNALLTEIGFFLNFLGRMKPDISFGFLNYILNITFLLVLAWKKNLFPLKLQLIIGIIGSIVFLILIPLSTMVLGKDTTINIVVTGGLVVLMGFINAVCSGGFFNLVSNFPLEMIVALSTGQGYSGIAMNVLQYIILFSFKEENEENTIIQAWIFFGVSVVILIISFVALLAAFNMDYFQYYLKKSKIEVKQGLLASEAGNEAQIIEAGESPAPELSFIDLTKKVWDLDLLITYTYIVTFALFPNASINQKVFNLPFNYQINTVITIYNVFDTVGRYIVGKLTPTKKLNFIVIMGRSILLFTLVFNYYCQEALEWNVNITTIFLFINEALLAATNGMGTTLCFALAPNEVENEYKGQVGTSISFFLIVGIFLGACTAFGTDAIIGTFKK